MKSQGQWFGCSSTRVAVLLIALPLIAGCRHTSTQATYSELQIAPAPATGSSPPAEQPVSNVAPAAELQSVALPNKLDPAWFQPPADLYTLGPGDRLEIEI